MKLFNFKILALAPLLIGSLIQGYAIHFVYKNSDRSCLDNVVNIYVARERGALKKIAERYNFKEDFYKGLALSNEYLQKARTYLEKGTASIPEYGPIISATVGPTIAVHKFLVVDGPQYFDKTFGKLLDQAFRKWAGVIAVQRNVEPGNSGFRGSFNQNDIEKEYGIAPGTELYVTIVGKANKQILMLDEPMKSNAEFDFIVKKDPRTGICIAIPVKYTDDNRYHMVPTGTALGDKNFRSEWIADMKSKLPQWEKNNKPLAAHVAKALKDIEAGKDPVQLEQGSGPVRGANVPRVPVTQPAPRAVRVPVQAMPAPVQVAPAPAPAPAQVPLPVSQTASQQ